MGLIRCLSAEIRLTDLDPRGSGVLLEGTDARSHSEPCSCAIAAYTPHNVLLRLLSEHCQLGTLCASSRMQLQGGLADDASDAYVRRILAACDETQVQQKFITRRPEKTSGVCPQHMPALYSASRCGAHQHGGQGGRLGEVEVLAGQPPPGEAGAALQRLALRKLRNATGALLPVIVRLERLGLWQAGTCSQQVQPVRPRLLFATASH